MLCFGQFQTNDNHKVKKEKKKSYKKMEGSPYLFKDWVKADLTHLNKEVQKDVMIRLDLHQENLEVKDDGSVFVDENVMEIDDEKFIVLADNYYKKIIITKEDNPKLFKGFDVDTVYLMKGIHKDYLNKYAIVLYDGEKVKLTKKINIEIREFEVNSPGGTVTTKKFIKKDHYELIIDKQKKKIKLKEKDLYKILGNQDVLKKYVKANKLKVKKENAAVKLLAYWDSLK